MAGRKVIIPSIDNKPFFHLQIITSRMEASAQSRLSTGFDFDRPGIIQAKFNNQINLSPGGCSIKEGMHPNWQAIDDGFNDKPFPAFA